MQRILRLTSKYNRILVFVTLIFGATFAYAMQASACHLISATITADCVEAEGGYQITYTITAYTDAGTLWGEYFLTVNGVDITPFVHTIVATYEGGSVTGSHGPIECGDYKLEGYVLAGGVDQGFGPVDVTCTCEPPECQSDLIAGQNWDSPAGVLTVSDDGTNLYVKFEINDGWNLGETHLYVGTAEPTKSAPGKFPYKAVAEHTIPLGDFGAGCGDTLYIAAHAVVSQDGQQEETAWADTYGIPFGKGWAMYFPYWVCYGCEPPQ